MCVRYTRFSITALFAAFVTVASLKVFAAVDESCEKHSNVVDAHKLNGKPLLAVGMPDPKAARCSTLQIIDALVRADKEFAFFADPGGGHWRLDSPSGQRKLSGFVVRHLLNKEE